MMLVAMSPAPDVGFLSPSRAVSNWDPRGGTKGCSRTRPQSDELPCKLARKGTLLPCAAIRSLGFPFWGSGTPHWC